MKLRATGKSAVHRAEAVLGPEISNRDADAIQAYGEAVDIEADAAKAWEKAGRLFTLELSNGVIAQHPDLKELHFARDRTARYRRDLGLTPSSQKGTPGRTAGAVSSEDRLPPITQLRRVQ